MKRAVVAALLLLAACSHDAGSPLPKFASVPRSYHVTYAVSSGKAHWTEDLWVSRPFDSDDTSADISQITATLGRQVVHAQGATQGVLHVPPNPAPGDVRLDAVVAYARQHGLLQIRGTTAKCTTFRSAKALVTRTMAMKPTARDHVDTCVDRHGLVRDETTVVGGKQVLVKHATKVELGVQHGFATDGTDVPLEKGGGRFTPLTDDSRPPGEAFYGLENPPEGFAHVGRYAVVPPQPRVIGSLATSVDDLFTRGPDVIVISNGHRAAAVEPGGISVGVGRLYVSAVGSRLVIQHEHGAYVEVRGTVAPATLIALSKSLMTYAPGTLVTH